MTRLRPGARRPFAAAFAAGAAALLAACTGGGGAIEPLPPPPSTAPLPSTTAPPDYASMPLPVVPAGRATTTSVPLGPGQARLEGKVLGPDALPVEAATVRVERLVGGAVGTMDVASGPDGGWALPGVLGGSYRVRAWRAPDLSMLQPALIFLGATDTFPLELKLERFVGTNPMPAVAPNPPVVGRPTALVIQVTSRAVDAAGIVQGTPLAGASLQLGGAAWTITGPNPATADGSGRARWELVCGVAGAHPLRLLVGGVEEFNVALPACVDPPQPAPPPPPSSPSTTRAGAPAGTSTTRLPTTAPRAATTTTTRPATTRPRS